MNINFKELNSGEEYTDFVRAFTTLLDKQFAICEWRLKEKGGLHDVAYQMPALISMVNTLGYLRGESNMFLDFRPHTDNQDEFYTYEKLFGARLQKLIDLLLASQEKQFYHDQLERYFIQFRTQTTLPID